MHINWKYWQDVISYHWGAITVFSGLVITSAVKSLPIPNGGFKWYPFFYDWGHTFFNLPNPREFAKYQVGLQSPPKS